MRARGLAGVVGGATSIAQGGTFAQGFAGSFAGALGGFAAGESGMVGVYGDGVQANQLSRALISAAFGCAGAAVTGGKCAEAAVISAFASLYNGESGAANLAKAFMGLDAEQTLRNYLRTTQSDLGWTSRRVDYPEGSYGVIDLLRQATNDIFEVKPLDGSNNGEAQLRKYAAAGGYAIGDVASIGNIPQLKSTGWLSWLNPTYSYGSTGTPGVIGWSLTNPGTVAATAGMYTGFVASMFVTGGASGWAAGARGAVSTLSKFKFGAP